MLKYLIRKAVYILAGPGLIAAGAYFTGHHDLAEWTIKGVGAAVEAAVAGAVLSGPLGGALSKKP